jgi:hypothetical protein
MEQFLFQLAETPSLRANLIVLKWSKWSDGGSARASRRPKQQIYRYLKQSAYICLLQNIGEGLDIYNAYCLLDDSLFLSKRLRAPTLWNAYPL